MEKPKWCLRCKKELGGNDSSLSFLGLSSTTGNYCKNSECDRYGLVTLIFLEEQKIAPKDAKTNDVNEKEDK